MALAMEAVDQADQAVDQAEKLLEPAAKKMTNRITSPTVQQVASPSCEAMFSKFLTIVDPEGSW